jgi:tetratricopeptide (TPR) repeat protein
MKRATKQVCYIIVAFLVLLPIKIYPQASARKEFDDLIRVGEKYTQRGEYAKALEYYIKAENLAEKKQWKHQMSISLTNIGIVYHNLSNEGEALGYYKRAINVLEGSGNKDNIPHILSDIGIIYANEKEYANALTYYKKAYALSKNKKDVLKIILAINISDAYNKLGKFKEAQKYLLEVKHLPSVIQLKQYWQVNYAESIFLEGKVAEAQAIIDNLIPKINRNNNNDCYFYAQQLLSKIYLKQDKIQLAILAAKEGLKNASILKDKVELYSQLSQLYFKNKEYNNAIAFKDSVINTNQQISKLMNRGLFESNKVKLRVQEYQNEVKINKEKYQAERRLFVIAIIFSVLLFFFIYRAQKNKIIKQKQEKQLAENEKVIFDLEIETLKNSIAEKNRRLSTKALYLSGRNELIEEVVNSLSKIPEVSQQKQVATYLKKLKEYIKPETEWDDFVVHFEKVNPGFLKTLKERYPELTAKDIRFLCYVYMNLDAKELSIVFNVTPDACRRREKRLLQKMNLNADDSLFEHLLKIT